MAGRGWGGAATGLLGGRRRDGTAVAAPPTTHVGTPARWAGRTQPLAQACGFHPGWECGSPQTVRRGGQAPCFEHPSTASFTSAPRIPCIVPCDHPCTRLCTGHKALRANSFFPVLPPSKQRGAPPSSLRDHRSMGSELDAAAAVVGAAFGGARLTPACVGALRTCLPQAIFLRRVPGGWCRRQAPSAAGQATHRRSAAPPPPPLRTARLACLDHPSPFWPERPRFGGLTHVAAQGRCRACRLPLPPPTPLCRPLPGSPLLAGPPCAAAPACLFPKTCFSRGTPS